MNKDSDNKPIRLLKKGRHSAARLIFSRLGIMVILIILQLLILISLFSWFKSRTPFYYVLAQVFTFCMALWLFNSSMDPSAKITWLTLIALFPVGGALLLLYTRRDLGHRVHRDRLKFLKELSQDKLPSDETVFEELKKADPGAAALSGYLYREGRYPVYEAGELEYFSSGRQMWERLLEELKKAKSFIFLEYFIIEEGLMWGEILKVLSERAAAGVDVRVMYDGTTEYTHLPHKYPEMLSKLGIKARVFAPLTPFISTYYNYRDHRKIAVIDSVTAFTGGANLADEYIGETERFGVWKDAAVMFRGRAARTFTRTFLEMWYAGEREVEFDKFLDVQADPGRPEAEAEYRRPEVDSGALASDPSAGFIIPYADDPLGAKIAEMVYIDILNRATDYVYIITPYLILDGEMETALRFAAKRGVDVRIILPGIPDKKTPYALAWTHYRSLLDGGVGLYHFTPGFTHAKVFVADDDEAVVGSINLDYRSLYHHFECALFMKGVGEIKEIKKDFLDTLAECEPVTYDTIKKTGIILKLTGYLIKTVAPLL